MARNLRKFVNPNFIETVSLDVLRRLLGGYASELKNFDLAFFDGDPAAAREAVLSYLKGPEDNIAEGLLVGLHRIAELSTRQGLDLLLQQARLARVSLVPPEANRALQDPTHVALNAFLDHPEVFEAASQILALYETTGVVEFAGTEEGVEAQIEETNLLAFERAARSLFEADLHGGYCQVDWYEDDAEIILVVLHGAPLTTTPIVENHQQRVVSLRAVEHALLSYSAADGRLKMVGVAKPRRAALAETMATCVLGRSGFFAGPDAQSLYTLAPVERGWPSFGLTHKFDPNIKRVQVVEAKIDRVSCDLFGEFDRVEWSFVARDSRGCALERVHERFPDAEFKSGDWRIGHIVLRVHIDTGGPRLSSVTVKIKPAAAASFKRQRFEGQIMELLRRNGFCRDRDADRTAVAAE